MYSEVRNVHDQVRCNLQSCISRIIINKDYFNCCAMLIGNVLIYVLGLLWLGILFGWDKPIIEWGLAPFLLGDLVKLALATALFSMMRVLIGRQKS